jgi:hypothetical protein
MTTPSPFEIGQAVGSNVSGAFRGARDRSAIDEILEQANSSGDPQAVNDAMGQILHRVSPERQQQAMQVLQMKQQQLAQQRQAKAYQEQGLNPDLPEGINKEILRGKGDVNKKQEGTEQVRGAFNRAQEILESGATGFSAGIATPQGRELRSELDTLSEVFISHLIPLLNPRGAISKERFNYIKGLVPNSTDTDAKIKGKLKALKDIFKLEGEAGKDIKKATREMKDAQGNVYDIPDELYEKAVSQGLK